MSGRIPVAPRSRASPFRKNSNRTLRRETCLRMSRGRERARRGQGPGNRTPKSVFGSHRAADEAGRLSASQGPSPGGRVETPRRSEEVAQQALPQQAPGFLRGRCQYSESPVNTLWYHPHMSMAATGEAEPTGETLREGFRSRARCTCRRATPPTGSFRRWPFEGACDAHECPRHPDGRALSWERRAGVL